MKQTPVYFEENFQNLNIFFKERNYQTIFILVDANTHQHCLPLFLTEFETESPIEIIEIPFGEENKTLEIASQLWQTLIDLKATRKSLLINLGGGVISDLGGFVASTFKRGIDFINVPTSLLGMVDAAIGGKTGVDLNGIKNMVGTFALPLSTFIHLEFLKTLSSRELRSGLAEMLKHGLIESEKHWKQLIQLENIESDLSIELIEDSISIKTEIIINDPYESGKRKILNFGHTIGHAIESEFLNSENRFLHGEAIAIGMLIECVLSYENELLTKSEIDEIFFALIHFFGKNPIDESRIPNLIEWMKHDKKNENNHVLFSLLNGIGHCKYDIYQTDEQIAAAILTYNRKLETIL